MLNIASTTEVMLRERPTNCLLYADDLVVFARSAKGLQRILNKLESFCEKADLNVNLDKTEIMIFNSSGKSLNNYSSFSSSSSNLKLSIMSYPIMSCYDRAEKVLRYVIGMRQKSGLKRARLKLIFFCRYFTSWSDFR